MKYTVLVLLFFTACTISNAILDQSPKYKVGDKFSLDSEFYLGAGVLRVTAVLYGSCNGKLQWTYLTEMKRLNGSVRQVIDDLEVCESELK